MTSVSGRSSTAGPLAPSSLTMSRSATMPATRRSEPITTSAPIRRCESIFTAAATLVLGSMVKTSVPLVVKWL